MPRIPENEIERIKKESDLVALVQSRGTQLTQKGKNWIGLCPFHEDKETPNLIVTPSKGLFRCMSCGKSGNAIQFVQWHDGVSFRHAYELLNGGLAFENAPKQRIKQSTTQKLPCPLEAESSETELLDQVTTYYHERLCSNEGKQARDYLEKRGLDDEAMVKKFRLGFSDRSLGLRMPEKNRVSGKALRERLETAGIYRKSGHEHLNGCLTIPIANQKGEVVQMYGRRIGKSEKTNRHLYLPKKLGGIFNPEALKSKELILTESLLDALTFYRHEMENVTCTYGTENFSAELLEAIKTSKIERIKLAFDADEAGEKATTKLAQKFGNYGLECHKIKLPWGMDVNEYALKEGGEALKQAVRNSVWLESSQKSEVSSNEATRAPSSLVANKAAKKESPVVVQPDEKPSQPEAREGSKIIKKGEHWEATFGERVYRIGGLEKNNSLEVLRVTLRVFCEGLMHVDSLDLYRDGERRKFIDRAREETDLEKVLLKRDLGKLLLLLEELQEERLTKGNSEEEEKVELTPEEEAEAMKLLKSKNLLDKISQAYHEAGMVGEANNIKAAYLACASRKLEKPLAIIIQSTSAAGKSTLMEAVLSFFPPEEQIKYSAMTGQSLYYLGEKNLKHKILAIVEEEGAEKASYALKLLQSEGELTIASAGKDGNTGRMETQEYHVEGPVAIIFTTTSIHIDEELMNRCLILTVDESREQTEKIHELQRLARTPEGILAKEKRKEIQRVMQNAQRLLKTWKIANPYAEHLTFTSGRTRTRRDHEKYLTLIDSIALLHQYQRKPIVHKIGEREIEMLPVTLDDIEEANKIAPEVLGRSLDELPPQTRRLLESIKALVRKKIESAEEPEKKYFPFSRRELREFTGWSYMQVKRHLERLEEMEYIVTRGGRNGVTMHYQLLGEIEEGKDTYHIGLIDVEELRKRGFK